MEFPTILGVLGDPVYIPAEEGVTKVGGSPSWLAGEPDNMDRCRCEKCGAHLALLLSCDCPIDDDYDRVIYMFICPRCGGHARSWRQKRPAVAQPQRVQEESNPLFTASDLEIPAVAPTDLLAALTDALKQAEQPKPKPKVEEEPHGDQEPGHFPAFYVDTFDEPEESTEIPSGCQISTSFGSAGSGVSCEEDQPDGSVSPQLVEYNVRLGRCPSQLIRYCRNGEPILDQEISVKVPPCPKCGQPRVFEIEVLPTIVFALAPESDMDFGPILLFTCSGDCGTDSQEEFCFVCPP